MRLAETNAVALGKAASYSGAAVKEFVRSAALLMERQLPGSALTSPSRP